MPLKFVDYLKGLADEFKKNSDKTFPSLEDFMEWVNNKYRGEGR